MINSEDVVEQFIARNIFEQVRIDLGDAQRGRRASAPTPITIGRSLFHGGQGV
jgi:hypothetical protein